MILVECFNRFSKSKLMLSLSLLLLAPLLPCPGVFSRGASLGGDKDQVGEFCTSIYSNPAMIDESNWISQLADLEDKFAGESVLEKKELIGSKSAGILTRLGMSEKIQVKKDLREGFIPFAKRQLSSVGFSDHAKGSFVQKIRSKVRLRKFYSYLSVFFKFAKDFLSRFWMLLALLAIILSLLQGSWRSVYENSLPQGAKLFVDNLKKWFSPEESIFQSESSFNQQDGPWVDPYIFAEYFYTFDGRSQGSFKALFKQFDDQRFGQDSVGRDSLDTFAYRRIFVLKKLLGNFTDLPQDQGFAFNVWYYIVFHPFLGPSKRSVIADTSHWVAFCPYWTSIIGSLARRPEGALEGVYRNCEIFAKEDITNLEQAMFSVKVWRLLRYHYCDIYYKRNALLKSKIEDLLSKGEIE